MATTPSVPAAGYDEFPTSFAQELLWLLESAAPGLSAYNVTRALRLTGPLDPEALARALDRLVARHEVLRTVYRTRECGATRQRVLESASVTLLRHDLSSLAERERIHRLREIVGERARLPFDLGTEIPLRATLIRLGPDEHALTIESHHIASDGWSGGILGRELSALYRAERRGVAPELPALPIQYADFASWQRDEIAGERLESLVAFWRARLADANTTLQLPTDRPRPAAAAYDGAIHGITLPPALLDGLKRLAARHEATLYMTVLAAFQTLLHRYTGQDDVLVGSPIAGRDAPDTEGLIGYFANTLVHRSRSHDDPSFSDHLRRVREGCLGAYQHQDLPFEKMMLELHGGRPLAHASLFQVVFTMLDNAPAAFDLDGVSAAPLGVEHGTTKFELTLFASERADGLRLACQYRTDLFDPETIDRMLGHLGTLLAEAVRDPSRRLSALPLMPEAERGLVLRAWNELMAEPVPDASVAELFEAQARRVPDRVAVVCGGDNLTFAELNAAANRLAQALRLRGVGNGSPVGLCLERSVHLIVGMLGILKAGGAYVPLVPELPRARVAQQLEESGALVVVTGRQWLDRVPPALALCVDDAALAAMPAADPTWAVAPDQAAYVLFTSGSTGTPKGVAVTHRNLLNYTRAIGRLLGFDLAADDRALHFATVSTFAADLGNTAIYPALLSGGCLHVIPDDVATDASAYADYVAARQVDVLKITPSHLRALMAGPGAAVLPNRFLVLGGEACPWDLVEAVSRIGRCRVINHYGPTETTVGCCAFLVGERNVRQWAPATVPVGRPLANVRAYVLDAARQPVPVGVRGELYVGGAGVALGYLRRPELTAERFLDDPFAGVEGARMYRTGDRVRQLPTGDIEFLGRADDQVKVRGYRVEPAEIESVIRSVAGVAQAAVISRGDRLVAYVCGSAQPDAIRQAVGERLPDYMVPHAVVALAQLPLTANGKLDRAALPDPDADAAPAGPSFVEPRTPTEATIAAIWCEVLKRDRVGTQDNFLELGGHSLIAIRILGRLSKAFSVRLPLRVLFEAPTVAALAAQIDQLATSPAPAPARPAASLGAVDRSAYRRPAGAAGPNGGEPPR